MHDDERAPPRTETETPAPAPVPPTAPASAPPSPKKPPTLSERLKKKFENLRNDDPNIYPLY